jgi:hypothetical protein
MSFGVVESLTKNVERQIDGIFATSNFQLCIKLPLIVWALLDAEKFCPCMFQEHLIPMN